jgi:tRNA dimethylallyltransferase
MIETGLVREVMSLLQKGYSLNLPSMSGIGYKQIGQFLQGQLDLAAAVEHMKYETHRLARHQYAWFHPGDKRIRWFDAGESKVNEEVINLCLSLRDESFRIAKKQQSNLT